MHYTPPISLLQSREGDLESKGSCVRVFPLLATCRIERSLFILALTIGDTLLLPSVAVAQANVRTPISLQNLSKGYSSGVREPLKIVIQTQDNWNSLWKRHSSLQAISSPAPQVDFATEMVAVIFLGEKRTGGYEVEITKAERNDSTLYLYYRERSPSRGGLVMQALTQPYHVVKLAKQDVPPVFLREGQ